MKKLLLLVAVLALAAPMVASAGTARWFNSASTTAKNVTLRYNVLGSRCYALQGADITHYNAHSGVYRDGVRRWDTVVCDLALPDRSMCYAVAYLTGPRWFDLRLGTFRWHGCTPYQLSRRTPAAA
jgi:hypothetical protein